MRFRFTDTGAIHKCEFLVEEKVVEYEEQGNLTITDTMFGVEAALEGAASPAPSNRWPCRTSKPSASTAC